MMPGPDDTLLTSVRARLQTAVELELATLPPYLYAMWSVRDRNSAAGKLVRGVLMEEMLHMVMACNLLCAVGGTPTLCGGANVPKYPGPLPAHSKTVNAFDVHLDRLSVEAVVGFMQVELPAAADAPPEADNWETIGQFYDSIARDLAQLDPSCFTGGHQVSSGSFAPGTLYTVQTPEDASRAMQEIVLQGEGHARTGRDDQDELAHYYQFRNLYFAMGGQDHDGFERFDAATFRAALDDDAYRAFQDVEVHPVIRDPDPATYPPGAHTLDRGFNSAFSDMLDSLFKKVNDPANFKTLWGGQALCGMLELGPYAAALRRFEVPGSESLAGPSFCYLPTSQRMDRSARKRCLEEVSS
ncbi:MAG: ferritin-like protein [Nannocystaceae bacterium]|nr:ferritin-like protein [Nannocystaceae bacterium]